MNAVAIAEMSDSGKQVGSSLGLSVVDVHAETAPQPEFFRLTAFIPTARVPV